MAEKKGNEDKPSDEAVLGMLTITGHRIEALDRSMMAIRQLYFVVLGILAAGFTNVIKGLNLEMIIILVDVLTLIVCVLAIILWRLDNHYHQYLYEAVRTSVSLERKLGLNRKNKLGLAQNFERWREESNSGSILPAWLYLLPAFLGYIAIIIIGIYYGTLYGFENGIYQISLTFAIISLLIITSWTHHINKSIPR